ncbi:ABC transporter permease [Micromonospora sp. CPCC 205558]|uniref:ABC transporter permease n=1 Tax=Micromonospora sp. CPCC 205558 TaxID=3122403 RepID=UPI002FF33CF5
MSASPGDTRSTRLAPTDVLRLGLLGLTTRRMRAVLSALGISIGIATLVVVVGIPASSQRDLMNQLSALGTNLLRAEPVPDQNPPALLHEDAAAMASRIGPVEMASAVANTHTAVRRNDLLDRYDTSGLSVLAARPGLLETVNGRMHSGRALDAGTAGLPTVVLGYVAAGRLGFATVDPQQPPQVFIGERWFTVIGILEPLPLSPDLDRSVLVGWDAAKAMLGFDGHPTVLYLRAREDALEDVRAVLPATLNPQLPGLVQVSRPSDALAAKQATENSFSGLFLGLAAVALLVGGIGVANTMVISVLERRREIGLRRALGANRGQIRVQFLTESVLLSVLGGAAGAALGVLATVGYASYQGWPPTIPLTAVAGGIAGALLVGVVAGVYPSIRAARLTPTEALSAP